MKWINGNDDQSNYEDRRGCRGKRLAGGGLITIIIAIIAVFLGKDPDALFQIADLFVPGQEAVSDDISGNENEDLKVFSLRVFNSCNDVWTEIFDRELGKTYKKPTFVTFSGETMSGCGGATAATGPFYCPADEKVYIDLDFFHELANRFHAPGDLAMAYVTAHEVGHHVQHLLGTLDKLHSMRGHVSEAEYNRMSVKVELQADFFAGLWANYAQKMNIIALEEGDLESAIRAAEAIGDDTLQKQSQGYVVPDAFTHGTSSQRMYWFKRGFETGDFSAGDTFAELK
ncbi:KPN_02809 family neutral zinc metallopeptidase [Porphyromonas gulae]|uniref:Metalloprotease n=1 Tax=Porphyromonas gulae TaxID=111105 RepID=A0A0A2F2T2_9PORP|nr:neutral zinc metallopeptidase [Porphyromonas gulae]KGN85318.1 metalloprotease [Porphyromonas gulae]